MHPTTPAAWKSIPIIRNDKYDPSALSYRLKDRATGKTAVDKSSD